MTKKLLSAEELREAGHEIDPEIPDEALIKAEAVVWDNEGNIKGFSEPWRWIEVREATDKEQK